MSVVDRPPAARAALRRAPSPAGRVLLNWGVIPGVANLVAAALLARRDSGGPVRIGVTFSARATRGTAGGEFLWRGLRTHRRHETAVLGDPPRRFVAFAEDVNAWLGGLTEGAAYVRLREPVLTAALLAVNGLALCRALPRFAFTIRASRPRASASREPFAIRVELGGDALTITGDGMYRCTAGAALAATEALVDRPAAPGCFDPHELLTLDAIQPALQRAGIQVQP